MPCAWPCGDPGGPRAKVRIFDGAVVQSGQALGSGQESLCTSNCRDSLVSNSWRSILTILRVPSGYSASDSYRITRGGVYGFLFDISVGASVYALRYKRCAFVTHCENAWLGNQARLSLFGIFGQGSPIYGECLRRNPFSSFRRNQ